MRALSLIMVDVDISIEADQYLNNAKRYLSNKKIVGSIDL